MTRILIVGMQSSPHLARWVDGIADAGWDLHLFGIDRHSPDPQLRGITLHRPELPPPAPPAPAAPPPPLTPAARLGRLLRLAARDPAAALRVTWRKLRREAASPHVVAPDEPAEEPAPAPPSPFRLEVFHPSTPIPDPDLRIPFGDTGVDGSALHGPEVLAELIARLKPDLLHSMEFQHCGYLVLAARDILGTQGFPPWLATNWGSDVYLFGRDPRHASMIRRLLEAADLYSCECRRDLALAREFGFTGPELPVLPNSGGMNLDCLKPLRNPAPPSSRRLIMVKGYDHFAGRAMVSLAVLERLADRLAGHEIVVYSATTRPRQRIAELLAEGRLDIRILDRVSQEEMLRHYARARIYLGVSLSDGISTSVLEAMAMGTFPIQTNTSCCEEWIEDGVGGFVIPPDDIDVICDRFARALEDDALVDHAAEVNWSVVENRLARERMAPRQLDFYEQAFAHIRA
jgi:glycosyltransferase involved in cell wall biosynthesis